MASVGFNPYAQASYGGFPQYGNYSSSLGSPFSASPVNPFNAVQILQQLIQAFSSLQGQWGGLLGNQPQHQYQPQAGQVGIYPPPGGAYGGGAPAYKPPVQANVAIAVNTPPPAPKGGGAGGYG